MQLRGHHNGAIYLTRQPLVQVLKRVGGRACQCTCADFARHGWNILIPAVLVTEAHNIVFGQVTADLNLDQFKRNLPGLASR